MGTTRSANAAVLSEAPLGRDIRALNELRVPRVSQRHSRDVYIIYICLTDTYPGAQPTINGTMATTPDDSSRPGTPSRRPGGPEARQRYTAHRA